MISDVSFLFLIAGALPVASRIREYLLHMFPLYFVRFRGGFCCFFGPLFVPPPSQKLLYPQPRILDEHDEASRDYDNLLPWFFQPQEQEGDGVDDENM